EDRQQAGERGDAEDAGGIGGAQDLPPGGDGKQRSLAEEGTAIPEQPEEGAEQDQPDGEDRHPGGAGGNRLLARGLVLRTRPALGARPQLRRAHRPELPPARHVEEDEDQGEETVEAEGQSAKEDLVAARPESQGARGV